MAKSGQIDDDTRRFVKLLAENERRLYAYVISLVPNWADTDDIVQQVKLRLWEQFDQYDPLKDFGAWACSIAHYLVLAHRKTTQRRHTRLSPAFVAAMAREATALADEVDHRHLALECCLKQLGETSRRLILMCYSPERTIKDVALALGRPVGATQKAVYRIRRRLQQCVETKMAEEARA